MEQQGEDVCFPQLFLWYGWYVTLAQKIIILSSELRSQRDRCVHIVTLYFTISKIAAFHNFQASLK